MATVLRVPDLRQQVYEGLRGAIRRGDYALDARFLEHTVAKDFGVSRTPAREALAMLVQDGLLVQNGRSFRFPAYTMHEIEQVFEVRRRLEPFAVRLAVERASNQNLKALQRQIEDELATHGKSDSYLAANQRIRDALFAVCGNERLRSAIQLHEDYVHFVRIRTLTIPAVRLTSVEGMHRLAAAVGARDVGGAEAAMDYLLKAAEIALRETGLFSQAEAGKPLVKPKRTARRRTVAS